MYRTPPGDRAAKLQAQERIAQTFQVNRRKKPAVNEADDHQAKPREFESEAGAHAFTTPARLRKTRSEFDTRSVTSNLSRCSIAKIGALESSSQAHEDAFLEQQREQDEIDKIELEILETKRKQLLKKKAKAEEFLREQDEIQEKIREIIIADQQDAIGDVCNDQLSVKLNVQNWLQEGQEKLAENIQNPVVKEMKSASICPVKSMDTIHQDIVSNHRVRYTGREFEPRQQHDYQSGNQRDEVLSAAFKALQKQQIRDLPVFNGENLLDWPLFLDEFQRSTVELTIKPSDNIRRLQKALQGKAKQAVQPLLNNPKHVDQIIRILKLNFGRTEWVMSKVIYQLNALATVQEGDLDGFKNFFNQVFGLYHATLTVEGEDYLRNPQLITQLAEKLPPFSRHEWSRYKANLVRQSEVVTMQHFLRWLEGELDIAFASYNPVHGKQKQRQFDKRQLMTHQPMQQSTSSRTACLHCKSNDHTKLWHCEKFKRLAIDDRRDAARKLRICFRCLDYGHSSKACKKETDCKVCGARHNQLLHKDRDESNRMSTFVNTQPTIENSDVTPEQEDAAAEAFSAPPTTLTTDTSQAETDDDCSYESENESCFANFKNKETLLRIAKVQVFGPNKSVFVYALFDEGSQSTMIDTRLAEDLQLDGEVSPVTYQWTGNIVKHHPNSMQVDLEISGPDKQSKKHSLKHVRTIDNLALPRQRFDLSKIVQLYPLVDQTKLKAIQNCAPRLLIGSDHASLIVPHKSFSYRDDGLQICKCKLGWTIHGPIEPNVTVPPSTLGVHLAMKSDDVLEKMIAEQYRVESFGITQQNATLCKDDQRALNMMENTITRIGNRYEIGLPYRYENMKFPESKSMALKRLTIIEKKMDTDQTYAEGYCAKIEDYISKGYARKLEPNEVTDADKAWYLPHFGVYNVNKPGKFRLVMDAKAKSHGVSLNDLLLKGPDFVPALVHVLWRARLHKVGFVADIVEMFHQILIRPDDRCSQRFLWRGTRRSGEPNVYEMNAMIFGAVSSPSQAQFVKNHNAKTLPDVKQQVIDAIQKQHYVDDYVDCSKTIKEATNLIQEVIQTHECGGFKLVKFISNEPEVVKAIPDEYRGVPKEDGLERVLGVLWDLAADQYVTSFDIPALQNWKTMNRAPTKREVLKSMMSVFDPLGAAQPLMIKLKIIFQDLWRKKLDWDDAIPNEYCEKWRQWLEEAETVKEVRIPRCYFPMIPSISVAELHTFCDASDKGYAAVAYLRVSCHDQHFVSFVQAKSKVAPIKHLTVPRMELQACVMGNEIARAIREEIGVPIVKSVFWTDSKIVQNWFTTNQKLNAFVGARVAKIFEDDEAKVDDWKWLPSALNVADLATKNQTTNMKQWISGPDFLCQDEKEWNFTMPELTAEELKCFHVEIIDQVFLGNTCQRRSCLPDVERFSKFNRLVRATAYTGKMLQALTLKRKDHPTREELFKLSFADLQIARTKWYKEVQTEFFSEEIQDLNSKGFVKRSSVLYTHSPFIHEGVLRLKSRVQDPDASFEENNPVILSAKHRFTHLLMVFYHESNLHGGVHAVINNLRQTFDIIGVTQAVKKIFRKCVICRIQREKPRPPHMAQLPLDRTTPRNRAFEVVGMDYAGPFEVTVGRRHEKRWICLFNDMASRGCDAEIVRKLTTDSAIKAIKRFANRRGVPTKIVSDNATCFRGADKELQEHFRLMKHKEDEMSAELSIRNIDWSFIPAGSPHFGGVYERKVKSIKAGLRVALNEIYPDDETFETAISDVINTINNTPIVELSSDPTEGRGITPNDLILGKVNAANIEMNVKDFKDVTPHSWMAAQLIADRFWNKWVKEYRVTLQRPSKWFDDRNSVQLAVGDIVLVVDETLKRNFWPKGIIIAVHPGQDKKVRAVTVKTQRGQFKRAAAKIILILRPDPDQHCSVGLENVGGKVGNDTELTQEDDI